MLTMIPVESSVGSKRNRWMLRANTPARWAGVTFNQSRVAGPIAPSAPNPCHA
ncbi:Uncharacterised protein [Shigella sonnei]|nr:Uncharacterised protein [Shigella sonnei]